jgi:hypothetical protein
MYVFNTWLVANLIHPLVLMIWFNADLSEQNGFELFGMYFQGFIYSFLFSLPALLIAFVVYYLLRKMRTDGITAFMIWLFLVTCIPFLTVLLLLLMFLKEGVLFGELEIIAPATIAVFISVALRFRYFMKAWYSEETVRIETGDNN